jgi:hypothetical protein
MAFGASWKGTRASARAVYRGRPTLAHLQHSVTSLIASPIRPPGGRGGGTTGARNGCIGSVKCQACFGNICLQEAAKRCAMKDRPGGMSHFNKKLHGPVSGGGAFFARAFAG